VRVLLDTHTLIWFYEADPKLSATAATTITDPVNAVLISPASYWEIAIKTSVGKLTFAVPYPDFIQRAIVDNGFTILPVEPAHAGALIALPFHHRDPFDRLLIAQAMVEGSPLVSGDPAFDSYPVRRVW